MLRHNRRTRAVRSPAGMMDTQIDLGEALWAAYLTHSSPSLRQIVEASRPHLLNLVLAADLPYVPLTIEGRSVGIGSHK